MFPLAVDLTGRRVLVIGAGRVGVGKAAQLFEAGARVTVISQEVLTPIPRGVETVLVRPYQNGDLAGAFLVVAATGVALVNEAIVDEANEQNMLINVVDDLERSNFYFTAVHRDGDVVVSVSPGGASPALAQWVRDAVSGALPKNLDRVARQLRAERGAIHARGESTEGLEWMTRVRELVDQSGATALPRHGSEPATVLISAETTSKIEHQG